MSTKGQIILPQAIRQRRRWGAGTRLVVEETPDGVLLKAESTFVPTRPEDVFGSARRDAAALSLEDMDAAITREVKRRHARGRY
jgi:AbrB family looped-hinge helix DNA binding protein